jgi:ssDNA-binding Zn-finger/Zn-ribbon topoisomerase 1
VRHNKDVKEPLGVCPKCGSAIDHLIYRTTERHEYKYTGFGNYKEIPESRTILAGEFVCPRCHNEVLTFTSQERIFREADSILGLHNLYQVRLE